MTRLLIFVALALPLAAQTVIVFDPDGILATLHPDVAWDRATRTIKPRATAPPPIPIEPAVTTIHTPRTAAELQAAIDKSVCADEIHVAGGATYSGNFVLQGKACPVTIRTSSMTWSAPGQRAKLTDAPRMGRIQSPNSMPALMLGKGSRNWRLIGLDIAGSSTVHTINLIQAGDLDTATSLEGLPDSITIERCLVRGDPKIGSRRGVLLMGTRNTVRDSFFSDFFHGGTDTQAIFVSVGLGPTLIENNYLEGAGENVFINTESVALSGLYPENITIRRNHIKKRLTWKPPPITVVVKNLLEVKSGKHIVIEANVFENNWASGQSGFGILFTCRGPKCAIEDVTFRNNLIRNSANGFNLLGRDDGSGNMGRVAGIRIENVLIEGPVGRVLQIINGVEEMSVSRVTALGTGATAMLTDLLRNGRITITDSVLGRGEYGMMHSGTSEGLASFVQGWQAWDVRGLVMFPPPCCNQPYPPGVTFVANAAAVPPGPGVDMVALNAAIAGVVQ